MSSLSFSPSSLHRSLKAAFIIAIKELPPEPEGYTLARIEQLCPHLNVASYWSLPGFPEWFTNLNEFAELAEMASMMALQTCMDVMSNPEEKGQARVGAAKLAVEVADKMPRVGSKKQLPNGIDDMNTDQLKALIAKAAPLLLNN